MGVFSLCPVDDAKPDFPEKKHERKGGSLAGFSGAFFHAKIPEFFGVFFFFFCFFFFRLAGCQVEFDHATKYNILS